ncbi:TetR family transcriptional regulator [Methylophaga sp. 41_12_T18]|nr:TetR family transcriptional regulator [Methylophaga sp. 41_12_T18]
MRYKPEQKKETHQKIIAAAGRSFRKNGFSGIGVDGLAKEAGVTSGAFYKHFPSKKAAFETIVVEGLQEVQQAFMALQEAHGENWWQALAGFYVSEKRTCDAKNSCGLQSLTSEVSRGDEDLKKAYEQELLKIASIATEEGSDDVSAATWQKLAMLVGGVTMARAVNDPELSEQIGQAIQSSSLFK